MGTFKYSTAVSSAITTLILVGGVAIDSQAMSFPEMELAPENPTLHKIIPNLSFDRYKLIDNANFNEIKKIEIIHSFASNLIENIEELPLEFSQAIDDNFWDLI